MSNSNNRPDREAFLRRIEEKQRQNNVPVGDEIKVEKKDNSKEEEMENTKSIIENYLVDCGMKDIEIDTIDKSSLHLLEKITSSRKDTGSDVEVVASTPNDEEIIHTVHEEQSDSKKHDSTSKKYEKEDELVDEFVEDVVLRQAMNEHSNTDLESKELQQKLLNLFDRQHDVIKQTKDKLNQLQKDLDRHTLLVEQFQDKYKYLLKDGIKVSEPPQQRRERLRELRQSLKSWLQRQKVYRVATTAYREVQRQNAHVNLDVALLVKLFLFFLVFGSRVVDSSKKKSLKLSFYAKYRILILFSVLFLVYLLQSGILSFLYRFFLKDLPRIWKEDNNNDHSPNVEHPPNRRLQRQHSTDHTPPATTPRTLTDGGIQPPHQEGGPRRILQDVKFFFASFVLSLLPTWRPVLATPPDNNNITRIQPAAPLQGEAHDQD